MLDRAVLDNQGDEIGVITDLFKVKRTYRGVIVQVRIGVQKQYGVEDHILRIPINAFSRTRERLDEVVLSRTFDKVLTLTVVSSLSMRRSERRRVSFDCRRWHRGPCLLRHSYDGEVSRPNCSCAGSLVGWSTRLITGRPQVQVLPRALFNSGVARIRRGLYRGPVHSQRT